MGSWITSISVEGTYCTVWRVLATSNIAYPQNPRDLNTCWIACLRMMESLNEASQYVTNQSILVRRTKQ